MVPLKDAPIIIKVRRELTCTPRAGDLEPAVDNDQINVKSRTILSMCDPLKKKQKRSVR